MTTNPQTPIIEHGQPRPAPQTAPGESGPQQPSPFDRPPPQSAPEECPLKASAVSQRRSTRYLRPAPEDEPRVKSMARRRGQNFGAAFARLNGSAAADHFEKARSFASAVERGREEAAVRDEIANELANDPRALRDMGF